MMAVPEEGVALRTGEVRATDLLETHLARTFASLEHERATGVLDVDASGLRTTFYLRDGAIVFAESGTVGETLGRVLVRRGTITEDQYRQILRRMTDRLVHDELMRFGEVAIELGILSPEQVSAGLEVQMRMRVLRCLQLDSARWIFRDDLEAVAGVARFSCPLATAVVEAFSEPQEAARWVWRLHAHGELALVLREPVGELGDRLHLGPAELRVLRALDTHEPIARLLPADAPDLELRAATIASLIVLDLAELRSVTSVASRERRSAAPPRTELEPQRAPAPVPHSPEPSARDHADAHITRAAEAAARLRDEVTRRRAAPAAPPPIAAAPIAASSVARVAAPIAATPPPPRHDDARARLSAEERYAEGRRLLREGKHAMALRELRAAAEAMPDVSEYRLADALADWLCADDDVLRAASADVLAHWVTVTLLADRRNAFAHYVQGRLYSATGDHAAALKAFTIATKLDPTDRELARWQRVARARTAGSK